MSLYKNPDIRHKTLEEAEENITRARVARLILAQTYQQTVLQRAHTAHDKDAEKFRKQKELFDAGMDRVAEQIEKLQSRLNVMNDTNSSMFNIENAISQAEGTGQ